MRSFISDTNRDESRYQRSLRHHITAVLFIAANNSGFFIFIYYYFECTRGLHADH